MSKTGDGTAKGSRAARILARSLFRDMRQNGYSCPQILALATELIDLVTKDMRGDGEIDLVVPDQTGAGLRRAG